MKVYLSVSVGPVDPVRVAAMRLDCGRHRLALTGYRMMAGFMRAAALAGVTAPVLTGLSVSLSAVWSSLVSAALRLRASTWPLLAMV
ncbi:hypothetical protein A5722_07215 [Mycobacterium vulneris]|nr:hypothetical protein A5722_07215 [Mycolicibacterium vulneris]OCB62394.1 hypothetical protein A5729_26705 [Mycolicibacterium vulneris]